MIQKVSIQGYKGSFHQAAAQQFFGKKIEVIPCATFREVIKTASANKEADAAVMAIENSIAGSILPNYTLLQNADLMITGEVYLKIKQNLLVNKGVKLEYIKEVHSHPIALLQCLDYLERYNWKLVETEDTALSAKHIHQHKNKHAAAVASKLAAELYNLDILAPGIETARNNYTRFLILQKAESFQHVKDANKASVNFQTDHSKGSLAKVLTVVATAGINLSKLQSFPIAGSKFKYAFHADMEFESLDIFNDTIIKMKALTESIKVYGVYKNGNV